VKTLSVDKDEVNRLVKGIKEPDEIEGQKGKETQILWQQQLLDTIKKLSPAEFERLCQRVLREAGFIKVNVTGKTGDGGIDGEGIVKIGGFLSFRVIFQCKRYQGSVSSKLIREFKGTMVGRADKGLFITTGTFTRDAKAEATRDGSTPIDLVDGEELVQKMKELGLGINIKTEELVEVDDLWFKNF
jgi:restriction system protein